MWFTQIVFITLYVATCSVVFLFQALVHFGGGFQVQVFFVYILESKRMSCKQEMNKKNDAKQTEYTLISSVPNTILFV